MLEDEESGVGAYWIQLFHLLPFQFPYFIIRLIPVTSRCPFVYLSNASMRPSQVALVVKNLPANAEDIRDVGLTPGLGRSPGLDTEDFSLTLWRGGQKRARELWG